jgi:GTPase SAR1 family protein
LIKSFKNKSNGREYILTVYDTAGLEKQEQILEQHIDSDGFILVYSIADRHSFEIIKEIYNKLVDDKNTPKYNF